MNIPKEVKSLPWPDLFEGNPLQHFRMHVNYVNTNHERLLVVTFCRNLKMTKLKVAPDFRYVLSKKKPGVVICYRVTNRRARKDLRASMYDWGTYPGNCYPEISVTDEKKLSVWLGKPMENTTNHMIPELENWITEAIQTEALQEKAARGELMDSDVDLCPEELPEGIGRFLQREVLPNDRTLIYRKGNTWGTCFCCREEVRARTVKFMQHSIINCPDCGKQVTCYLNTSDSFKVDYVQNIASVQKGTDGKTVFVRLWHLRRDSSAKWENVTDWLEEVCRWGIRGNKVAKWQKECKENWYMKCTRYDLPKWTRVDKPSVIYDGDYIFYTPMNQEEIFEGTSLCYCDLEDYMNRDSLRNKNPIRFLMDWVRYSMVEKLWKAGYTNLVYEKTMGLRKEYLKDIKWTAKGIGSSLRIPKHLLKLMEPKEWCMNYLNRAWEGWEMVADGKLKERELLDWIKSGLHMDDIRDAMGYASFNKIMKYLSGQADRAKEEYQKKREMGVELNGYYVGPYPRKDYSQTYRDYLSECNKLHLDLSMSDVLFPKNLDAAHERTIAQVKYQAAQIKEEGFQIVCQKNRWMEWEQGDYLIRLPVDGREVIEEGQKLHHCVGGYVDRMADGKTLILLIRQKSEPEKPFYTLEWLNNKVQQCHTTYNRVGPQEEQVRAFVQSWEKELPKLKRKKTAVGTAA